MMSSSTNTMMQEPICLLASSVNDDDVGQNKNRSWESLSSTTPNNSSENNSAEEEEHVSLVTAINRKYGSEQCSALPCGSAIFMKANDHLPGKRRPSGSLELLVLNEQRISVTGDLNQLSPLVRNITELDLAFNQLSSWREVLTILTQMPHLVHANLSHNPLRRPLKLNGGDWSSKIGDDEVLETGPVVTMRKMNNLVLNATGIRWQSLFTLLGMMPNLEELHLSLNDYSKLADSAERGGDWVRRIDDDGEGSSTSFVRSDLPSFPHIHNLHLNHCQLKSWPALVAICRLFPCLETLVAAGNHISSIVGGGGGGGGNSNSSIIDSIELTEYFGCLHTLNINYWPLENWIEVDNLRKFPLLSELRINHIPSLKAYEDTERRNLLIARLPDVTLLNGSPVTSEQRENAERFFIRYYLDKEEKPERYTELESIHGRLMPLADIDLSPKDQADVVLIVDEEKRERRHVSLNQNVVQFKKSLQSFCNMPPGRFRLFFRRANIDGPPCMMMEELKLPRIMLHSLYVEDDDEFHILAKPDPPARRRTSSSNSGLAPTTTTAADSPTKLSNSSNREKR